MVKEVTYGHKCTQQTILFRLVVFRVINAFLVRSYAHPDEFWQAQEVAHVRAFGYGYLSWEWNSDEPLRSPIHSWILTGIYNLLKLLHLDYPVAVAYTPRLFQGIVAGFGDYGTYVLAKGFLKERAWLVIIVLAGNWFSLFSLTRGYIQNLESTLLIWGLIFWYKNHELKYDFASRILMILTFTIRHTSLVFWAAVWLFELIQKATTFRKAIFICFRRAFHLCHMIAVSVLLDSLYYGKLTSSFWYFIKFNIIVGGSEIYGVDSFWMYISKSIPLLFITWLPLLLLGIISELAHPERWTKSAYLLFVIGVPFLFFSHHPHKEDRFMTILIPYFSIFTAIGLKKFLDVTEKYRKLARFCIFIVLSSNLLFFSYSSFVDKSGALASFDYIRDHQNEVSSLAVLTECHRTPYVSFIHKNFPIYFPDCSPRFDGTQSDTKKFELNPSVFFYDAIVARNISHILTYDDYISIDYIDDLIRKKEFYVEKTFFNSFYADSHTGYLFDHHLVLLARKS